jgi:hypothetical protein
MEIIIDVGLREQTKFLRDILGFRLMKKILNNFIVLCGVLSLAAPLSATTYLDMKFREAIEGNQSPWMFNSYRKKVEQYLEKGANINEPNPATGETPLLRTVSLMMSDTESYLKAQQKVNLAAKRFTLMVPGVVGLVVGEQSGHAGSFSTLRTYTFNTAGLVTFLYGLFHGGKAVKEAALRDVPLFSSMAKFELFKLFLKHPSLDLTLTNREGKTVFDLVEEYRAELAKHYDLERKSILDSLFVRQLRDMERLLEERRLELEAAVSNS